MRSHDEATLLRACMLAARGAGRVEPNPLVGCIISRGETTLGCGHHRVFGGPHAEVEALASARRQGHDVRGATMHVTLEPCAHHGRNPPCVDAIRASGIARVVIGARDPNPIAAGGLERLRAAGVACECVDPVSDAGTACARLIAPFVHRLRTSRPWTIAKWAQTLDGRVATRTGDSKWISSPRSRDRVHRLRGIVDAIVTGIGTVVADDPMFNVRRSIPPRRIACRVVADTDLTIPLESRLVTTARDLPTLVACERSMACTTYTARKRAALDQAGVTIVPIADMGVGRGLEMKELLEALHKDHHASTVLIEAGPGILGSLIEDGLIDEARVYIAPLVLGDARAKSVAIGRVAERLSNARAFELLRVRAIGPDIEAIYRRVVG